MTAWPLVLLLPLLAAVAVADLRMLRIPNILPLASLGLFLLTSLVAPPDDTALRLLVAAATLVLGTTAFAFRLLGGGDVKMLAALMLFVPVASLLLFLNILALSLLAGMALVLTLRRMVPAGGWRGLSETRGFPAGVSIAMAGGGHCAALLALGG